MVGTRPGHVRDATTCHGILCRALTNSCGRLRSLSQYCEFSPTISVCSRLERKVATPGAAAEVVNKHCRKQAIRHLQAPGFCCWWWFAHHECAFLVVIASIHACSKCHDVCPTTSRLLCTYASRLATIHSSDFVHTRSTVACSLSDCVP